MVYMFGVFKVFEIKASGFMETLIDVAGVGVYKFMRAVICIIFALIASVPFGVIITQGIATGARSENWPIGILIAVVIFGVVLAISRVMFGMIEPDNLTPDVVDRAVDNMSSDFKPDHRRFLQVLYKMGLAKEVEIPEGRQGMFGPETELEPKIEYLWVQDPGVGQADVDTPAVLMLQKSSLLKKKRIMDENFYGGIEGVRDVLDVKTSDVNNDFWRVEFVDELAELPEKVKPRIRDFGEGRFYMGKNVQKERRFMDFAKAPNLLIAGGTGSGKSVLINHLVACCVASGVRVAMLDPDGQLSSDLKSELKEKNLLWGYAVHSDQWLDFLNEVQDELELRASGESVRDPLVIFTDETARLMQYDQNIDIFQNLLERVRKQKMAVISAFQSPSARVVPTVVRDNFVNRCIGKLDNVQQVASLFPGYDNLSERVRSIQQPGEFLFTNPDIDGLERIKVPYSELYEADEDEGW